MLLKQRVIWLVVWTYIKLQELVQINDKILEELDKIFVIPPRHSYY